VAGAINTFTPSELKHTNSFKMPTLGITDIMEINYHPEHRVWRAHRM